MLRGNLYIQETTNYKPQILEEEEGGQNYWKLRFRKRWCRYRIKQSRKHCHMKHNEREKTWNVEVHFQCVSQNYSLKVIIPVIRA